jgi:hypothetical protein
VPFPPQDLPNDLKEKLEKFVDQHDFVSLYQHYEWRKDTWESGFPNILQLELEVGGVAKSNILKKENIISIIQWGNPRNASRVKVDVPEIKLPLYKNGEPAPEIRQDPYGPLQTLKEKITSGAGLASLSKILRFALPSEFGAIDSRIVRVMGEKESWLSLKVYYNGSQCCIKPESRQREKDEYSKWINILRFLAQLLNSKGVKCPHPKNFEEKRLRNPGEWTCADVEMALFSYATQNIPEGHSCPHHRG